MAKRKGTARGPRPATERPLSARSVVASVLLGVHPPRLPTRVLVRAAGLFGITEGAARTALSRMTARGELEPDGDGYRLVGHLLERQATQDIGRAGRTLPWSGDWVLAVVSPGAREAAERLALRRAADALRMAELREGVWTRPDNLPAGRAPAAEATLAAQCQLWVGQPSEPPDVGGLFALEAWARVALGLIDRLEASRPTLDAGDPAGLAAGFLLSAEVLRHLRRDPLLPADLLPPAWPGDRLRVAYGAHEEAFVEVWRTWLRSQG